MLTGSFLGNAVQMSNRVISPNLDDDRSIGYGCTILDSQKIWLVKTDAYGNMQWNKTYGRADLDVAESVIQGRDGAFVLAGWYQFFGQSPHAWYIKIDTENGLAWTDSTLNSIVLYRGVTDGYWNFVRVRIWKVEENP